MAAEVDTVTQRPRTPNDPYTLLTEEQIRNIKKDPSPHFHTVKRESATLTDKKPREGGRYYRDHYCNVTSEHLVRGGSSQPFGWIGERFSHEPSDEYNTCRGRAHVRWGPNKAGERTRSHFFGETIDRYTTIDMYRRPPTNYPGPVIMDHGRATQGYYGQRNPNQTTWFGSSLPLNRAEVMGAMDSKTKAEYEEIQKSEQMARESRKGQWPEFSEYTSKYLLHNKTEPELTSSEEKKKQTEPDRSPSPAIERD